MIKNRRKFIGSSAISVFGIIPMMRGFDFATSRHRDMISKSLQDFGELNPSYPITDPEMVRKVVGASHTQFEVVKELVSARPELAKATQDWGFGDVESALGAASHMGRKDIADFLMEHGARPNIFTYAMMGKLGTVKAMIEDIPGIQKMRGPHGFTLLHHANMRLRRENVEGTEKEEQEALVDYLKSLGDADVKAMSLDITAEEQKIYVGKYTFGNGEDEFFDVTLNNRKMLSMGRGSYFGRSLLRTDTHTFAPGGAPSVRISFEVQNGTAQSVTIHDPAPVVKAMRKV